MRFQNSFCGSNIGSILPISFWLLLFLLLLLLLLWIVLFLELLFCFLGLVEMREKCLSDTICESFVTKEGACYLHPFLLRLSEKQIFFFLETMLAPRTLLWQSYNVYFLNVMLSSNYLCEKLHIYFIWKVNKYIFVAHVLDAIIYI